MSQAVVVIPINELGVVADAMYKGGLFGFKNKEQAFSLMILAQAQGQHPATIVQDYHIFSTGKAGLRSDTVLARFQDQGGTIEWLETTDTIARAKFTHPKAGSREFAWTIEEAKRAKLAGKDVWAAYPSDMLRARCIFRGVRAMYPKVFGGMYGMEEVADMETTATTADGEFKEVAQPALTAPTAEAAIDKRNRIESLYLACNTQDEWKAVTPELVKAGIGKAQLEHLTGFDATETWKMLRERHWNRIVARAAAPVEAPPTPDQQISDFQRRCIAASTPEQVKALETEFHANPILFDSIPCAGSLQDKAGELGVVVDLEGV